MNTNSEPWKGNTPPGPNDGPGEYVVIETSCMNFYVRRATAARVAQQLDRWFPPRWLEFEDLANRLIRLRPRMVQAMRDSTYGTRIALRDFYRLRRKEDNECNAYGSDDD